MRAQRRFLPRAVSAASLAIAVTLSGTLALGGSAILTTSRVATAHAGTTGQAIGGPGLASLGAPAQMGTAGPDSPTSFNATLPNGRRVTPAGTSVQVGENPLGAALSPDGQYLVVSNDDERNAGKLNTVYSGAAVNGAGKVPGGYTLAVVRTSDMQVITYTVAPKNTQPNPGVQAPGRKQSDGTAAFFLGVAIKPGANGANTLYASGGPSDLVNVYTLGSDGSLTLNTSIHVPVPTDPSRPNYGMSSPGGLTLSADGSRLYVVNNNANTVITIDTTTNTIVGTPVPVGFFPYAAALSPDGSHLYVSNWGVADRHFGTEYQSSEVTSTAGISGTGSPYIGGGPAANLFANPVSDPSRSSSLSVVDLAAGTQTAVGLGQPIDGVRTVGGTHPSALAAVSNGQTAVLYVTNANEDSLALVDMTTGTLIKKVALSVLPGVSGIPGLVPNALAVSPDNTRLYVALAGLNAVAVYDVSDPQNPIFQGLIPTGWYPTAVTVSPDGSALYVTNAKGLGSDYAFQGAVPGSPDVNLLFGSVQKVDLTNLDLNQGTAQVSANTYSAQPYANYQLMETLHAHIQHVIFILRENKTYDSYLGADAVLNGRGANGSPANATYDAQVPNTKALAEQFAVGDNAYADSEESNAGHSFALAGASTDYQQKTQLSRFSRPFINTKNEDPEDYPLAGYMFNNAARQGLDYRNYGDMVRVSGYDDGSHPNGCVDDPYPGCISASYVYSNTTAPTVGLGGLYATDVPALAVLGGGHTDEHYPGWNLRISDQRRAQEFITDMGAKISAGTAPAFTFLWLPDDHTGGGIPPTFSVADNDTALGKVVSFISHSAIWPGTALFVTEDDAQGSADHVNAHRSYTMVISPYARRGTVVHRLSSTVSIPKTIEELLGMPAMNLGDLVANDLADYFTTTPDFTPYTAAGAVAQAPVPAMAARIARLTSKLAMGSYDRDNARLGQINTLFFRSVKLATQRGHMNAKAYRSAQDGLYRIAESIVGAVAHGV